jgi:hypothetical protein
MLPGAYPDYNPQVQGLLFLGFIVGTLISEMLFSGGLSDYLVQRAMERTNGERVPEKRLLLCFPAAVCTCARCCSETTSNNRSFSVHHRTSSLRMYRAIQLALVYCTNCDLPYRNGRPDREHDHDILRCRRIPSACHGRNLVLYFSP